MVITLANTGSHRETTEPGAELQLVSVPPRAMPSVAPGPGASGDYKPATGGAIFERFVLTSLMFSRPVL